MRPENKEARVFALRRLISRGIPCILWAEDAMYFFHSVGTKLFTQQILVPDDMLESAAAVLKDASYVPSEGAALPDFFDSHAAADGTYPTEERTAFPRGIRLRHHNISDHDGAFAVEPLPSHILLLPQSYFGLDVCSSERFQSMVPPFDPSNSGILVPKYHTFLEGLIEFLVNPPTGFEKPHLSSFFTTSYFIQYLVSSRRKNDPPLRRLAPVEAEILSEIQTDDARWYLSSQFGYRKLVDMDDIIAHKSNKAQGRDI